MRGQRPSLSSCLCLSIAVSFLNPILLLNYTNNVLEQNILSFYQSTVLLPFLRVSMALYISLVSTPCPWDSSFRQSMRCWSAAENAPVFMPDQVARSSRIDESACSKVSSNLFHSESGTGITTSGHLGSALGCRKCVVSQRRRRGYTR